MPQSFSQILSAGNSGVLQLAREGGPLHLIADGRIPSDTKLLGPSLVNAPGARVLGPGHNLTLDGIGSRLEGNEIGKALQLLRSTHVYANVFVSDSAAYA